VPGRAGRMRKCCNLFCIAMNSIWIRIHKINKYITVFSSHRTREQQLHAKTH
jgi:hypothetical protein